MSKRLIKAGLRIIEHNNGDRTHRKQIPIDHGFRMFFTSQLVNSKLQPELRWLLEGHALKANDKSYVRVKDQLHDEYVKAINNLTINPENRLKEQVKSLEADRDEITLMKLEHRQEMKKLLDEKEENKNRMENLTSVVQIILANMNNMNQESKSKLAKSMIESGIFK